MTAEFEVLVRGGDVVDGTGGARRRADVGIVNGLISAVGDLSAAVAGTVIDATGAVVTPGFIDTHAHTDFVPFLAKLTDDVRLASIRQGVTTEVCGNCGGSPAPTFGTRGEEMGKGIEVLIGDAADDDAELVFSDFAGYVAALGDSDMVTNLAPLVGHGTLRIAAMGFDARPATADETAAMCASLDRALEQGAFGVSSGLIYPPGMFSETDELIALASVAARHGRLYASHMRDEMDHVEDSVAETLRIGQESGAAVQISHHKVAGRANWGRQQATLTAIERARATGLDVTADVYPYTAGSTALYALMPPWLLDGGPLAMLPRIADRSVRDRMRREYAEGIPGWQNLLSSNTWADVVIAHSSDPSREGVSIADLARDSGRDAVDTACDVLIADDASTLVVLHMMAEDDVRAIVSQPYLMIGSDGIALPGKQHPRLTGAFARIFSSYVRDARLFSLEEAVRKMTSLAAEKFGIADRGTVTVGQSADLVVLFPDEVADRSTYVNPFLTPIGIKDVLLNGQVVVRDGQDTGVRAGKVLTPA